MGKKKTETTQTQSIGQLTPEQQALQKQILAQLGGLQGQMGNLSALAGGNLQGLNPEIARLIEASQAGARRQAEQQYNEAIRSGRIAASASGIDGSSAEAIAQAMAGQTRDQTMADLNSQAAQMQVQLPFQLANTQLQANQLLQGAYGQGSQGLLNALVQQRLGQGTTTGTQTQSGGVFGQLLATAGNMYKPGP
jgi:hypothetical protein